MRDLTLRVLFAVCLSAVNIFACFGQNHNKELAELYRADQRDRQNNNLNFDDIDYWVQVMSRDSARLARVYQLLDSGKLATGQDYYHAAMICQHGGEILASDLAVSLMQKAIETDSTISKWLLAAAIDRNLVKKGRPQIYGTQFLRDEKGVWSKVWMDSTIISDEERKALMWKRCRNNARS